MPVDRRMVTHALTRGVFGFGVARFSLGLGEAGLGRREGNHARHEEDEPRREPGETGADGAATGFPLILTSRHARDNVLVAAPIPEADDGRAG